MQLLPSIQTGISRLRAQVVLASVLSFLAFLRSPKKETLLKPDLMTASIASSAVLQPGKVKNPKHRQGNLSKRLLRNTRVSTSFRRLYEVAWWC